MVIISRIRASIVVSIPACHAGDRSSILRLGAFFANFIFNNIFFVVNMQNNHISNKNRIYNSIKFWNKCI